MIKNITQDIKELLSNYPFIKSIKHNKLIISKRPTSEIIEDLDMIDRIIKVEDSYDYLLNMSVRSLTEERMNKLLQQIKDAKSELDLIKASTIQDMWIKELK